MAEKTILILVNGFILFTILLLQILIPSISRRNILLGVKIPKNELENPEIKKIIKAYKIETAIVGIIAIALTSLLLFYQYQSIIIISLSPIIYMIILFFVYLRWNKKVKELKEIKEWSKLASNTVVIDAKFSRDKIKGIGISKAWYLIPFLIGIFNIILSLKKYPSLPNEIPVHWDLKGNIDGYMDKSLLTALMLPIIQIIMGIFIYGTNLIVMRSKQEIGVDNPEIAIKKNMIFRKIWSINLLILLILMNIIFTTTNMMVLGILDNILIQNTIIFGSLGFILIILFVTSIVLGQGGERLKLKDEEELASGIGIDDDKFWKIGNTIYYNPDDPSIIVEKRIGVGWTVNMARPLGKFLLILPIIIAIISIILAI